MWQTAQETHDALSVGGGLEDGALAWKYLRDETLIKMVAMRAGLCDLIEKNIIDFAIDFFNGEHAHGVQKRLQKEQTAKKEIGA